MKISKSTIGIGILSLVIVGALAAFMMRDESKDSPVSTAEETRRAQPTPSLSPEDRRAEAAARREYIDQIAKGEVSDLSNLLKREPHEVFEIVRRVPEKRWDQHKEAIIELSEEATSVEDRLLTDFLLSRVGEKSSDAVIGAFFETMEKSLKGLHGRYWQLYSEAFRNNTEFSDRCIEIVSNPSSGADSLRQNCVGVMRQLPLEKIEATLQETSEPSFALLDLVVQKKIRDCSQISSQVFDQWLAKMPDSPMRIISTVFGPRAYFSESALKKVRAKVFGQKGSDQPLATAQNLERRWQQVEQRQKVQKQRGRKLCEIKMG